MNPPQLLLAAALIFTPQAATQTAAPSPEKVTITSTGGATIPAEFRNGGPGSPGVLLFPMCDNNATDGWAPVAEHLRRAGVSSLLISYRIRYDAAVGERKSMNDEPAHADAALAYLQSRIGDTAVVAVTGSSCGVYFALRTAMRHPKLIRALVAFAGPHTNSQVEFIRNTPNLSILTGSAELNMPAPEWARALKESSRNPASRMVLASGSAHGTDVFAEQPKIAVEIADWLASQLK